MLGLCKKSTVIKRHRAKRPGFKGAKHLKNEDWTERLNSK